MKKYFPITSVSREDIERLGFNSEALSDERMESIATAMGQAYVESGAFEDTLGGILETKNDGYCSLDHDHSYTKDCLYHN